MAVFKIPLEARNQITRMQINGINYQLRVMWNKMAGVWILDIFTDTGFPILCGIPLITGANLLGQYEYKHIGNDVIFIVLTLAVGHSPSEIPSQTNLGTDGNLYYITP